MSTTFSLAIVAVAPLWALMLFAPRWQGTQRIVGSLWAFVPLCVVYVALVAPALADFMTVFSRPELTTVAAYLATPRGATVVWVHVLVFDALAGRAVWQDAIRRAVPHVLLAPCLLLTFFAGPAGLLAYLGARAAVVAAAPEHPPADVSVEPSTETGAGARDGRRRA